VGGGGVDLESAQALWVASCCCGGQHSRTAGIQHFLNCYIALGQNRYNKNTYICM